ncbi:MAG TPA: HAD-IC family P-type ATPase [Miltoncostaeaceae bacterium]|nr:HAD-IC family P-type ATPase [Miltoncostaeaceae bacterium]
MSVSRSDRPGAAEAPAAGVLGLTEEEARRRLEEEPPKPPARGSRSVWDIVWSNTATVFNLILGGLLVLILAVGSWKDGLFGFVIIANTAIGIVQELRAKRTLDRLALLVQPRARVWRDGVIRELPPEELVVGDAVHIEPGDQVVADGEVLTSRGLTLDESILTGESDAIARFPGDEVHSGAACVAGSGDMLVTAVGGDRYAEQLAAEARGTRAVLSPLQLDINRILRGTVLLMVPLAVLLVTSLLIRETALLTGVQTIVAALVPLVPEGLVLLASLTFAVAAVRLARLGALAQRLNSIESLASVDTICLDKTGTLTDERPRLVGLVPADGHSEDGLGDALGALAASAGTRNATFQAVQDGLARSPRAVLTEVPFSSARKWSGATLEGVGTVVAGAPDILEAAGVPLYEGLRSAVAEHAADGRRVILVAAGDAQLVEDGGLPDGLSPLGLALLAEGIRDDSIETIAFLRRQGVRIRIISGDAVETVSAVARACGVPDADRAIAGPDLTDDPEELARVAERTVVFGRVVPEQKRSLIAAMTRDGRYVAMVGDGVNDVLALKEARLAVAMGGGSQMAKGVADLVLLRGGFATVPPAIAEGRRILRNTHRVAKLFVSKTVYAAALLATIGLAPIAFPFLPRHLSVTSSLTIGIPAFFLALAPSTGPVEKGRDFMRSLLSFAIPAGLTTAAAIGAAYLIVRGPLDEAVVEGRTAAVLVATAMGLGIVVLLERESGRVRWWVWAMVGGFALALTLGLRVPWLRNFFEVAWPSGDVWVVTALSAAAGLAVLVLVLRAERWRNRACREADRS